MIVEGGRTEERRHRRHRRADAAVVRGVRSREMEAGGEAGAGPEDWLRLDRLLVLGSERGALRTGPGVEDPERLPSTVRCVRADAERVVARVREVFEAGRLAANGAGVRVLALVTALGDDRGRAAACAAVPEVCRTAVDLFRFAEAVTALRGWGRSLRRAVGNWYRARFADDLAYQVVKCPRRDGWSHRDLLRLAHPTPATREQAAVFRWILGGAEALGRRTVVREIGGRGDEDAVGGLGGLDEGQPRRYRAVTYPGVGEPPRLLRAVEEVRRATSVAEVVRLIVEHDLPREAVPASWLGEVSVWEALLHRMPTGTMIGDLGALGAVGLLRPGTEAAWWVETRLRDPGVLRSAGLHPMAYYLARRAYEAGQSADGRLRWEPVPAVVRALDDTFQASMRWVRPVGRPLLVALDLSRSARSAVLPGTRVTVLEAAAAMAVVSVSTEATCLVAGLVPAVAGLGVGGDARLGGCVPGLTLLDVRPGMRVEELVARLEAMPEGIPDGSVPVEWAGRNGLPIEGFVVYTDGGLWGGGMGMARVLAEYRSRTGLAARSVVVGMGGVPFEVADPGDAGMLDVVGCDGEAAELVAAFLRG